MALKLKRSLSSFVLSLSFNKLAVAVIFNAAATVFFLRFILLYPKILVKIIYIWYF